MRKVFTFLAAIAIAQMASAQWAGSSNTSNITYRYGNVGIGTSSADKMLTIAAPTLLDGSFLAMGKLVGNNGIRNFNFDVSYTNAHSGYSFYDDNGKLRSAYTANSNLTFFGTRDSNGQELFKVSGTTNDAFIHMPKLDSKLVIGDFASYLDSEGHKLIVKDGSAKIEGDIFTNAHIGIGTDQFIEGEDEYRLSVNGRVRANMVKVYTDWADYVFEDTYKLPTLGEVEDFIEENGHLKDIPSAVEVEANGIDVGEMNKLLLQKVEELTLYMIEKDKEVKALEDAVKALTEKLNN